LYPAKLEKAESSYSAAQISKPPFVNFCRSKFSEIAELALTDLGIVFLGGGQAALQRVRSVYRDPPMRTGGLLCRGRGPLIAAL